MGSVDSVQKRRYLSGVQLRDEGEGDRKEWGGSFQRRETEWGTEALEPPGGKGAASDSQSKL